MRRPNGCAWDGNCDSCGWSFCIATPQQALRFYHREELETQKRYGRGLARPRKARAKLTAEEKAGIMQAIRDGESLDTIAERYDIVRDTARNYKKIVNKVSAKTDNSTERYDIVRDTARNYKKIVNKVSAKTDNSKGHK